MWWKLARTNRFGRGACAFAAAAAIASGALLAGCGGSGGAAANYKDGTYEGASSVLDIGVEGDGYGEVSITVENGAISKVDFRAYQVDGSLKDENYGKDAGGSFYNVAQAAVAAGDEYAYTLEQTGVLSDVDTVSGATYLHDQFVEAAEDALSKATE